MFPTKNRVKIKENNKNFEIGVNLLQLLKTKATKNIAPINIPVAIIKSKTLTSWPPN